ncbi:MAG TPA: hypothetical protein VFD98_02885 [Terracidiphilus sp.]|nr:hypothetical protein [Terracidiphilus sp.]
MNPRVLPRLFWPRRSFLQFAGLALSVPAWSFASREDRPSGAAAVPEKPSLYNGFPTQPPELVQEMVRVSHFDLKRVQQLVGAQPSLARAAWDWGFGDWESALGAASHMGNRPIAEYLISKGARPSLFSAAMLGHLEVVKAFVTAQPGVQRIRGPHSISLLAHAKAGGDAARPVADFLDSLGDAGAESQAPLAQTDLDAILGVYPFGPSDNDRIDLTADKGTVTWTRRGAMGRPLFHLGDRVFYPWGASAVRIRFLSENGDTVMTVNDPGIVLTARKAK